MLRTLLLGRCTVVIDEARQYVETRFPGGALCPAVPQDTPGYADTARSVGYGEGDLARWLLCKEHEALHTWLMVKLGHPWSPTLHAVAHGFAPGSASLERQWAEESMVLDFQRVLNGVLPTLGVSLADGWDLGALRREAWQMLRGSL